MAPGKRHTYKPGSGHRPGHGNHRAGAGAFRGRGRGWARRGVSGPSSKFRASQNSSHRISGISTHSQAQRNTHHSISQQDSDGSEQPIGSIQSQASELRIQGQTNLPLSDFKHGDIVWAPWSAPCLNPAALPSDKGMVRGDRTLWHILKHRPFVVVGVQRSLGLLAVPIFSASGEGIAKVPREKRFDVMLLRHEGRRSIGKVLSATAEWLDECIVASGGAADYARPFQVKDGSYIPVFQAQTLPFDYPLEICGRLTVESTQQLLKFHHSLVLKSYGGLLDNPPKDPGMAAKVGSSKSTAAAETDETISKATEGASNSNKENGQEAQSPGIALTTSVPFTSTEDDYEIPVVPIGTRPDFEAITRQPLGESSGNARQNTSPSEHNAGGPTAISVEASPTGEPNVTTVRPYQRQPSQRRRSRSPGPDTVARSYVRELISRGPDSIARSSISQETASYLISGTTAVHSQRRNDRRQDLALHTSFESRSSPLREGDYEDSMSFNGSQSVG